MPDKGENELDGPRYGSRERSSREMGAGDLEFLVWLFLCCPAAFCCWRERVLFLKQNNDNKKPYQLRNLDQFEFNLVFYF